MKQINEQNAEMQAIVAALAAPFDPAEVRFKPQAVSGNRALAVPFVDARMIQDRLDDVLGVMNWQDSYEVMTDGTVLCRLKVRICGEWITKEDVGGQSEQPDGGDRRKSAFSDALKRAAVKFGIGRYLYRSKPQWCDYDPQKREFTRKPTVNATPHHAATTSRPSTPPQQLPRPATPRPAAPTPAQELLDTMIARLEAWGVSEGHCNDGELTAYLTGLFGKEHGANVRAWPQKLHDQVKAEIKKFFAACKSVPVGGAA